jgi:hypothetical protein
MSNGECEENEEMRMMNSKWKDENGIIEEGPVSTQQTQ